MKLDCYVVKFLFWKKIQAITPQSVDPSTGGDMPQIQNYHDKYFIAKILKFPRLLQMTSDNPK
jgi:hypothetical protein